MKNIKKKFNIKEENNYNLKEVIIITLSFSIIFSSLTAIILFKKLYHSTNNTNDLIKTYNEIVNNYYGEVDEDELTDAAVNGMVEYLNEKYSVYMDSDSTTNFSNMLDGTYDGIGIEVTKQNNNIIVLNVYDDTPASKAGIKNGDIIKNINGTDVTNYDVSKIADLITDQDEVKIVIERDNKEIQFTVKKSSLDYPVVNSDIFEVNNKKIGYIYLSTFSKSSYKQVKNSLEKLEKENIDSLIFDVRSNTGGYLTSVTNILELFVMKGKTLYITESKDGKSKILDDTKEYRNYPVVVLVNSLTASASEILASSLKESYGAIIVGTKTYGKGKVQSVSTLSDSTLVKYTTANWYTPNGNSINEVGITPGIYIELSSDYLTNPIDENDAQLQKALEVLSKK